MHNARVEKEDGGDITRERRRKEATGVVEEIDLDSSGLKSGRGKEGKCRRASSLSPGNAVHRPDMTLVLALPARKD